MRGRAPIVPHRRRQVPPQFSWVDHRLVRDGHLQGRSASALALYLFLVTVADAEGLSWYSDEALCRQLSCTERQLHHDRDELQQAALIAWRRPLYQVLDLSPACASRIDRCTAQRLDAEATPIGAILQQMLGGAR